MSTTDDRLAGPDRDALPEFELEYLYDDPEDPSKVTVFPTESDSPETEWVLTDYETAVSLRDIR